MEPTFTEPANTMAAAMYLTTAANARDKNGQSLLFSAKSAEQVQFLVAQGADVNIRDNDGNTPLHNADNAKVARALLEAGADLGAKNSYGDTPLHSNRNNEDIVKVLLQAGADPNATNKRGRTPLFYATKETTPLLIKAGAEPDTKDNNGRTALFYAGSGKIAKDLLEAGADVNAQDNFGARPLHKANLEVANVLLIYEAWEDMPDKKGNTPLHYCTDKVLAERLLQYRADPNTQNELGRTPLFDANFVVSLALLAEGAKLDIRDNNGKTVLDELRDEDAVKKFFALQEKMNEKPHGRIRVNAPSKSTNLGAIENYDDLLEPYEEETEEED